MPTPTTPPLPPSSSTASSLVMPASPVASWSRDVAKGAVGMEGVVAALRKTGRTVIDVSALPMSQSRDIDLLVDGEWVEVKSDFTHYPNVYLELTCDGKPGCVYKSRADSWLYYRVAFREVYLLPLAPLQWWVALHQGEYARKTTRTRNRGNEWDSTGIAVPLATLVAAGIAEKLELDI